MVLGSEPSSWCVWGRVPSTRNPLPGLPAGLISFFFLIIIFCCYGVVGLCLLA